MAIDAMLSATVDAGASLEADARAATYAAGHETLVDSRVDGICEALPEQRYDEALVLGAEAALTRKLARRCERVGIARGAPSRLPEAAFDLVIACDVAGAPAQVRAALAESLVASMRKGAHLVVATWTDDSGADDAAADFIRLAGEALAPISRRRTPYFRLDVLERV